MKSNYYYKNKIKIGTEKNTLTVPFVWSALRATSISQRNLL